MSAKTASDLDLIEVVSKIVSEKSGIILGERQKQMVQGRIARRVRECGLTSTQEYHKYLLSNVASETTALVSLLTTHHTFFFREFEHFEHMMSKTMPEAFEVMRATGRKKFRILSAACSKGHEVYSLAMFLKHNMPADLDFEIVGGDICTESVEFAKNGVYRWEEVKTIPATYLHGNWARGTGQISEFAKISDVIRAKCRFDVMNLSQMTTDARDEKFDVVFCRNVFIYFEKELVRSSVMKLLERLHGHGDLVIGLSESLNGLDLPVVWEGPSVYRHRGKESAVAKGKVSLVDTKPAVTASVKVEPPIRVFAVDDSPTVLKLLEKMCKEVGFEFLGSAKDGEEALRILTGPSAPKPSLITLDLHMPKMNGLEFLKEFRKVSMTPVIVVSSINREENELAQQALAAGAGDYVEKPAMDRWKQTTAELVAKARVVVKAGPQAKAGGPVKSGATDIDAKFSKTSHSDRRWVVISKDPKQAQDFATLHGKRIEMVILSGAVGSTPVTTNGIETVALKDAKLVGAVDRRSILVFGECDEAVKSFILAQGAARVVIEETSGAFLAKTHLRPKFGPAVDVCPATSFAYEADRVVTVPVRATDPWQKTQRKAS